MEHGRKMGNNCFAVYCRLTVCKVQWTYPFTRWILTIIPTRRNSMPNFFNTKNVMKILKEFFLFFIQYSLKNVRLVGKDFETKTSSFAKNQVNQVVALSNPNLSIFTNRWWLQWEEVIFRAVFTSIKDFRF